LSDVREAAETLLKKDEEEGISSLKISAIVCSDDVKKEIKHL